MNLHSPADARLPRYHRLRDALVERIAQGQWRAGQAIPTEAELAQEHAVSVGTVRKAVDALVAQGLLERFQGRGTFVRRPCFDASLFRFFRLQNPGPSGERQVPQSRILRREVIPVPADAGASLGLKAGALAIHFSRLRVINGQTILAEDIWLPRKLFARLLDLPTAEFGDLLYPLYESRCGQIVASAQETLTAEALGDRHAKLLGLAPGTAAIVIERLALGANQQPLEWRRSRGPAAGFRYEIEIR